MEGCHTESQSALQGDVNDGGGTSPKGSAPLLLENPAPLLLENLSSTDHERIQIQSLIGGRLVFPCKQESPSHIYVNQESLSGFLQDSSDTGNIMTGLQQKVNGAISRRMNFVSTSGKHALRQQARRRRRNTSIAAGNSPPITRVTMKSSAPSAACSPSGASPTRNHHTPTSNSSLSPQSQYSPLTSSYKPLSKSNLTFANSNQLSPYQLIENISSRNDPEAMVADNMARIIVSKINCCSNKTPLENSLMNYLENNRSIIPGRDTTVIASFPHNSRVIPPPVQSNMPTVRSSSRLASGSQTINNSTAVQVQQTAQSSTQCQPINTAVPSSTTLQQPQGGSRTLRVCPPQSSPSTRDSSSPSMTTMQSYLASIPGFKPRKRSQRKLSTAAQLAQTKEGSIDLETPDSILVNVNLKALINVDTFSSLPPTYQHRLAQLLPRVDQIVASDNSLKVISTGFHNEFLARACVSWRERLSEGEFTHDNQVKLKGEAEKERSKLDPWKVAHFEPVWGMKKASAGDNSSREMCSLLVSVGEENDSSLCSSDSTSPHTSSSLFTDIHISQLTKVVEFIASRDQRRRDRREGRRAERLSVHQKESELENQINPCFGDSLGQEGSIGNSLDSVTLLSDNQTLADESSCSNISSSGSSSSSCSVNVEFSENNLRLKGEQTIELEPKLDVCFNLKRKESPVESEHVPKKSCSSEVPVHHVVSPAVSINNSGSNNEQVINVKQDIWADKRQINKMRVVPSNRVMNTHPLSLDPSSSLASSPPSPQSSTQRIPSTILTSSLNSAAISWSSPVISLASSPTRSLVENQLLCGRAPQTFVGSSVIQVGSLLSQKVNSSPTSSVTVKPVGQSSAVTTTRCSVPDSVIITQSSSSSTKKIIRGQQTSQYGNSVTLRISKGRSQGGVNLQRSYEIVQGVIANSPNREQLQAQLKHHRVLLAESKSNISGTALVSKPNAVQDQMVNEKESSIINTLNIAQPQHPPPRFATPKGVPATASIQAQTLTVLKTLPNTNCQFTHAFAQGAQSIGQFLPTGQKVFRSVALPLAAINSAGNTMMIRPVVPSQVGSQATVNEPQQPTTNLTFIQQSRGRDGCKPLATANGPITILRPSSGGKPVFLRTLSVSNVHLVRVSDILNSGRSDGDQHPPRASSAPPSRNSLVMGSPNVVPRPNSVGPKTLITTSTSSSSSSPAQPNYLPPPPSPSCHFLSEGDLSSGAINSSYTANFDLCLENHDSKVDQIMDSEQDEDSVIVETRAGANSNNAASFLETPKLKQFQNKKYFNSSPLQHTEILHNPQIPPEEFVDQMQVNGLHQYSLQPRQQNVLHSNSSSDSKSNDSTQQDKYLSNFLDNESSDSQPHEESVNSLCATVDNNQSSAQSLYCVSTVNNTLNTVKDELEQQQFKNETDSLVEANEHFVEETSETHNHEEDSFHQYKSDETVDNEDFIHENRKENFCVKEQEQQFDIENDQQQEHRSCIMGSVGNENVFIKNESPLPHVTIKQTHISNMQHQHMMMPHDHIQQRQNLDLVDNEQVIQESSTLHQGNIAFAFNHSHKLGQNFHQQQNPYQLVQQDSQSPLHQHMMHKQTYYVQQQNSGVVSHQQGPIHTQNTYHNVPITANIINNVPQQIDSQPMALNIHTFTNLNNNQVITNPPQTLNMINMNNSQIVTDGSDSAQTMSVMSASVGSGFRKMCAQMENSEGGNNRDSSGSDEGCPCNMRAMVACMKCGAFCHHDCISPTRLCVTCLIR